MLTHRIIPCLDVRDGRVVKGVQFGGLRDVGCPVERAIEYEQQGADEIVILDVTATGESRRADTRTVERVRAALSIPLTVGGGVRRLDDAAALLDAGADKVGINTAAVRQPALLGQIAGQFGVQCTVLAIDARGKPAGGWAVVIGAGSELTQLDVIDWARRGTALGAGEDPADELGPRWHPQWLRPGPARRGRRSGARADHRLGRRSGPG